VTICRLPGSSKIGPHHLQDDERARDRPHALISILQRGRGPSSPLAGSLNGASAPSIRVYPQVQRWIAKSPPTPNTGTLPINRPATESCRLSALAAASSCQRRGAPDVRRVRRLPTDTRHAVRPLGQATGQARAPARCRYRHRRGAQIDIVSGRAILSPLRE
jgi:hypothetical protein